jgi:hypothetical protein
MSGTSGPTCLVIADIAGYTGYLAGVELDHAQDILGDLVGTVVGALRPTFKLAKLEGDAAFAYVVAETLDGSLLQDTIERTYFSFRRRLRDIEQASQCECNACIRIPTLDLKLVVHHGPAARQRMAGREELVGRDVILVHRLLKNSIHDATGVRAYAAYTQACVDAMGADPVGQGLLAHRESTDLGDVNLWIRDLAHAWAAEQDRVRVEVIAADAWGVLSFETPAPPSVAWDYVTSPKRRPSWGPGITEVIEFPPTGRRGVGTTNHCMHGKDAIFEEILDWRPFDYWTTRSTMPMPGAPKLVMTDAITPLPGGGSLVEVRIGKPVRRDRERFAQLAPMIEQSIRAAIESLAPLLEAEAARIRNAVTEPLVEAGRTVDSGVARSSLV